MVRAKWTLLLAVVLFLAACGKNGPYDGYGYGPYTQAPGYPGTYPYGYGGNNGYGGFNPQLPSGYPSSYTPFLPVDYYMRNHPTYAAYWPSFWNQWTRDCRTMGYSPYNFSYFWYSYVPRYWAAGPYQQFYSYFNSTFYYWMAPGAQFATSLSPQQFWSGYSGYGYWNG